MPDHPRQPGQDRIRVGLRPDQHDRPGREVVRQPLEEYGVHSAIDDPPEHDQRALEAIERADPGPLAFRTRGLFSER